MPAKRTSNAANKSKSKSKARAPQRPSRSGSSGGTVVGTVRGDIIGVLLAVFSLALLAAILFPSTAVVTSAVHDFLALACGVGAPLVPCAIFVCAVTFFLEDKQGISGRVALGLCLVVLAILAMISLNLPAASNDANVIFEPSLARQSGGYVGGAVAYGLHELVGVVVGNIVLLGVAVSGVVVCGFSVSGAVGRARESLAAAVRECEERTRERRERYIIDAAADEEFLQDEANQASLFDSEEDGAGATFIGIRKNSVL